MAVVQIRLKSSQYGLEAGDVITLSSTNTNHRADIGRWIGHTVSFNSTNIKLNMAYGDSAYLSFPNETQAIDSAKFDIRFLAWR